MSEIELSHHSAPPAAAPHPPHPQNTADQIDLGTPHLAQRCVHEASVRACVPAVYGQPQALVAEPASKHEPRTFFFVGCRLFMASLARSEEASRCLRMARSMDGPISSSSTRGTFSNQTQVQGFDS